MNIKIAEANNLLGKVKKRQQDLGWSNAELARQAGVTYAKVRFWLGGTAKMPGYPAVKAILDALEIGEPPPTVPIVGRVPGGIPMVVAEDVDEEFDELTELLPVPYKMRGCYGLVVDGNSMNNVAPDGMRVVFDPNQTDFRELDGKLVIASINGECTFKRLRLDDFKVILEPDSTDKSHTLQTYDPYEVRIIGRVIYIGKVVED